MEEGSFSSNFKDSIINMNLTHGKYQGCNYPTDRTYIQKVILILELEYKGIKIPEKGK
jgi:hypothetical protein